MDRTYLRSREIKSRENARVATSDVARIAHETMADRYAARIAEIDEPPTLDER